MGLLESWAFKVAFVSSDFAWDMWIGVAELSYGLLGGALVTCGKRVRVK